MLITILSTLAFYIFIYYLILSMWYTTLLVASFPEVLRKFNEVRYGNANIFIDKNCLVPITVVTPVFNEEESIMEMVLSVLNSDYKNVNLILVNDGSTDTTMDVLKKELVLYEIPLVIKQTIKTQKITHYYQSKRFENITVIDKEHSPYNCAADSLNAGLNACKTPIMLTVDADTILEPEALTRMLFTILSTPHCVVVSGSVYVLNDNVLKNGALLTNQLPKHYLSAVQAVEYLRSFLYGRAGLNALGGALCYPGAFTLFETRMLREIDGFDTQNYSYDAEIITKIHHYMRKHKYPHNVNHSPNAFCWTDVPSTLKSYWRQRNYWQRGMLRSALRHITMLFNIKYGIVGLLTFPAYILFEIFGPVVEFTSLILFLISLYLGAIDLYSFTWYIILSWGFLIFVSVAMVFLNLISFNKYKRKGDVFRVIGLVTVELFGFRQYRALCCTVAMFHYALNRLRGKPL